MPEPEGARPPAADAGRVLDACRDPVLQVDPDGRVAYANAAARTVLGLAPGEPVAAHLDPPSRADLDALLADYLRDGAFPEDDRAWAWTGRPHDPDPGGSRQPVGRRPGGRVRGHRPPGRRAEGRPAVAGAC